MGGEERRRRQTCRGHLCDKVSGTSMTGSALPNVVVVFVLSSLLSSVTFTTVPRSLQQDPQNVGSLVKPHTHPFSSFTLMAKHPEKCYRESALSDQSSPTGTSSL